MKRLKVRVAILGDYGVVRPEQHIEFDDKCPMCGESGLEVKGNNYCSDGEHYSSDNINCKYECSFRYDNLVNLTGFRR